MPWIRWTCKRSIDRKSTRLNSSHLGISYAVFCLKKKNGRPDQAFARTGRAHDFTRQAGSHVGRSPHARREAPGVFFNDTATTEIYTLSLHDALPISPTLSFSTTAVFLPSWAARIAAT